jgi:hypothetical protein
MREERRGSRSHDVRREYQRKKAAELTALLGLPHAGRLQRTIAWVVPRGAME